MRPCVDACVHHSATVRCVCLLGCVGGGDCSWVCISACVCACVLEMCVF